MTITQLEDFDKNRKKVYIDEEFAFVLYNGELRQYGIKINSEISEEVYKKIMTEVLSKRAKLRAMNLLTKREYTVKELRKKLKEGFYPETIIDEALDYVSSFHYTDDVRYALWYIGDYAEQKSKRRIIQDLTAKGISDADMETAFDTFLESGRVIDEESQIKKLLQKRHFDMDAADYRAIQKEAAYLSGKGYETDLIFRVLKAEI